MKIYSLESGIIPYERKQQVWKLVEGTLEEVLVRYAGERTLRLQWEKNGSLIHYTMPASSSDNAEQIAIKVVSEFKKAFA